MLAIDFDLLSQGQLPPGVGIRTQFPRPDVVPGVVGDAWRTDGFSSWAEAPLAVDPHRGFTLIFWVALESYPSDREVPVAELSTSSLAQQATADAGFDLPIDTFGRWGFRVSTTAGIQQGRASARFPLHRWVQVGLRADPAAGTVTLFQDGQVVASANAGRAVALRLAEVPLRLATPPKEATLLDFVINRLNGAYDALVVHGAPLSDAAVMALAAPPGVGPGGTPRQLPDAGASLVVPDSRFAADHLRPRVHPMPPANWTNEPHGLVHHQGQWHLFYQRTPNGPFKTQMHWGHMASADLVRWRHLPDALRPELQTEQAGFDMKGIWSGHVITDGDQAFAFYTSVNHGDRLGAGNPAISVATSRDRDLRDWRKLGPIIDSRGLRDMRDPVLWRQGGTWHMLIGAALDSGGGLQYRVLEQTDAGPRWQLRPRFAEPGWRQLDIGSEIWEMPVFEPVSADVWVLLANPIGGRVSKYGQPATRALYWTGRWDGSLFKPFDTTPKPLDLVPGHLAPTVGRAADGRLRAIGIIDERRSSAAQRRAGWAHTFSLPRTWFLLPDGRTLGQAPAPELLQLRGAASLDRSAVPLDAVPLPLTAGGSAYEVEITLAPPADAASAKPVALDVLAAADGSETTRLLFDPAAGRVTVDLSRSSLSSDREGPAVLHGAYDTAAFGAMRTLRAFVDGSVIQVFINDAAAFAVRSYPALPTSTQARLSVPGGTASATQLRVWPLQLPPAPS